MICNKKITKFYSLTEDFALGCSDDINAIKEAYKEAIKDDDKEIEAFIAVLPRIKAELKEDLQLFMESDPAVDSEEEVVLAYPGYKAIRYYRIAHVLYKLGEHLIARILTEEAHFYTGIDIHPGAEIACPFFIDHGTGIVIGETSIVGKRVKMYQSVTLGALSLSKGREMKGIKRHPTIGDDVTLYAGVSILGGDVTIGNRVTIGSNVFLTESIPDDTLVTIGKPELVVKKRL